MAGAHVHVPVAPPAAEELQPGPEQAPHPGEESRIPEDGREGQDVDAAAEDDDASTSPEGHSQGPFLPSFLAATHVLPKQPLQEYTHAGQEAIAYAFTPASRTGIRSLPDAMCNDFRHQLMEQLIANHQAEREARREREAAASTLSQSPTRQARGTAKSQQLGRRAQSLNAVRDSTLFTGHKPVTRVHPYSGAFSSIEYMPSEYGRPEVISKFERLRSKCAQVHPAEFKVAVPPQGPQGAPSFSVYEAISIQEPYVPQHDIECAENRAIREGILAGPFVTGRRVDKLALLRGRADECMYALCKLLSTDWPSSFLQVFEDVSGGIVVSFDGTQAIAEGDLSTYMQNMVRNNGIVSDFHLQKDGAQWGVVDEDTQSVFYLLWPPWVRHRYKPAPPPAAKNR